MRAWYGSPTLRERPCGGAAGDIGRAMQLGFNTNFRYRDVVFHVQTEDSGRANPHVITHLFHGGNILASVKRDYSDLLAGDDLESAVRKLMETQHKAMLKQLSRGEFDGVIRERLDPELFRADAGSPGGVAASPDRGPLLRLQEGPPRANSETGSSATDQTPGPGHRTPARPPAVSASSATPAAARASAERTAVNPERRDTSSGLARVFGERVVSEKPLDEVVLDYLVENARKRKRQPKP